MNATTTEIYHKEIKRDTATSLVLQEAHYLNDKLHRDDGPALLEFDPVTFQLRAMEWCRHGRHYRVDGPAIVKFDGPPDFPTLEVWVNHQGNEHRENGPSQICRDPQTGEIVLEEYHLNGIAHNDHGPSLRTFDPETGDCTCEEWRQNGILTRTDGPADYHFDPSTGVVTYEEYLLDGRVHRLDGPAIIQRDRTTGEIILQTWVRFGQEIDQASKAATPSPSP